MSPLPSTAFGGPDDRTLWHYTTQDGLLGICAAKSLWCSDIKAMNDSRELHYARYRVIDQLTKMSGSMGSSRGEDILALLQRNFESEHAHPFWFYPFVVSFCTSGDRLSQWRGYASGGGFSIGFSEKRLQELGRERGFELVECVYDEQEQNSIIQEFIDKSISKLDIPDVDSVALSIAVQTQQASGKLDETIVEIRKKFTRLGCILKNPAFREENEWRLIANLSDPNFDTRLVKVRRGRFSLLRYVPFDIDDSCLRALVAGPAREKALNLDGGLHAMFSAFPDWQTAATWSDVPYRE